MIIKSKNNKSITCLQLTILIILSVVLRFYLLGSIPKGFSSDEASLGYNAYSILLTGKDEYGTAFPLAFKSFGEYKAPLYIYSSVIPVVLFGLNEFSTRFSSALFGVLTVVLVFFIARKIFNNENIGFVSGLILSILPWYLQFTRIAYEGSPMLFFLCLGVLLFIKGLNNSKYLYISIVCFIVTLYCHYAVRIFLPIFLLILLIMFRKKLSSAKKELIISLVIGLILFLPLISGMISKAGLSRASYTSFLTDQGMVFSINEKRAEHKWNGQINTFIPMAIHNKFIEYPKRFLENYISHFDLSFLFINGDKSPFYKTPNSGPILFSLLPFLFLGIYQLFRQNNKAKIIILAWLFLSPIPSSLTRLEPSTNRMFIMVVPVAMVIGLGIDFLIRKFLRDRRMWILVILAVIFMGEYFLYLDNYYTHLSIRLGRDTKVSIKQTMKIINRYSDNYGEIWVTPGFADYIHFLFYLKYSPEKYQLQAKLSPLDEYGFGHVEKFDKYYFGKIPKYFDFYKNILYVASPNDISFKTQPLDKTVYPDGQDAFFLLDTNSVKRQCPSCSLEYKPTDQDIYGNNINLK